MVLAKVSQSLGITSRYGGCRAEGVRTPLPSHLADGQENVMEASEMGLTGMVFSTIAIAAGAVMYWAVTNTQGHGFRLSTVGVILMIVGASAWLCRRP
jgi:hypothetical protein